MTNNSTILKEQSFILEQEHYIIDLLIQKQQDVFIIDYKTSNEHNILHKKQINIYIKGIKKILNTDKVFGYIVYLNKENIDIIKA
jgi:ATP-dependent exoDNAse (exonuclease V) beta subunit